jgi:hypothetical protein
MHRKKKTRLIRKIGTGIHFIANRSCAARADRVSNGKDDGDPGM